MLLLFEAKIWQYVFAKLLLRSCNTIITEFGGFILIYKQTLNGIVRVV